MVKWKLENDGDDFEREYWPRFKNTFSNYEIFWSEFITPMGCRNDVPRTNPLWIQFKQNVDGDLQNIGMAHYTIFRCLAANWDIIRLGADSDFSNIYKAVYNERFDMFYANLGSIIDMASSICFFFAKIQKKVGLRGEFIFKRSSSELEEIFNSFIKKEYDSRLKDFSEKRRPVHIAIHKSSDFIYDILGKTSVVYLFIKFSEKIKQIRNVAIHNPVIGTFQLLTNAGITIPMIPKPDKLRNYYLWGDLFYNNNLDDFVDRERSFLLDFDEIMAVLNRLWEQLIPRYRKLTQVEGYERLLGNIPGR